MALVHETTTRYSRQTNIAGWNQEKIFRSTVDIVGAGALGTPVGIGCALLGIGTIHLYDRDVVEETNLNRQFLYTEKDIGKPKVKILSTKLMEMNPGINVNSHV